MSGGGMVKEAIGEGEGEGEGGQVVVELVVEGQWWRRMVVVVMEGGGIMVDGW